MERLRRQAQLVNPITRQYLIEAEIAPGMRVLDVGSGVGDVAFLAAELVGPSGEVVGDDRSPDALGLARSRAKERSLANVTFRENELSAMAFDQLFDAAIGRYVLGFQPDPAGLLRKIARLVRPGGIVLFHEPDLTQKRSYPPTPTYYMMFDLTDEAFHHKFGKIWADKTIPKLTESERNMVEDWAAHCAQSLLFNNGSPQQQQVIYGQFGLDPERVLADIMERRKNKDPKRRFKGETNVFRVLIKTLLNAGLITARTRGFYSMYIDMDELSAESTRMVGDDIAEEGIRYLQAINFKERDADKRRADAFLAAE